MWDIVGSEVFRSLYEQYIMEMVLSFGEAVSGNSEWFRHESGIVCL
jgi:hypothetical protein